IGEYYQAALLAEAGYPVIRPVFSSTETGKQLLIYEVIESPSVFDVAWAIETGLSDQFETLRAAQQAGDDHLLALYRATLGSQSPLQAAQSPVHQLFYHRLRGGRLARFYGPLPGQSGDFPSVALPGGVRSMSEVRPAHWEINGQVYSDSLDDVIERALRLLQPEQAGPAVIGHGDAHNGNVFLQQSGGEAALLYFDPAFAGEHHPLLDLTKPLFHNVFAMWMYFPHEKQQQTPISLQVDGHTWRVTYDYALPPVRSLFWESKVERVLIPILIELKQRGRLRPDWRVYLKAALFCCPFLTMNLTDSGRFPPEISLLGLAMAVEMGADSQGERSLLDRTLDRMESEL
ncbi:MAG: phosphotransferase, partial [Anaerolineae bacterium]|nr:phosphotransferase [Anaerolineae bacterium]